MRGCIEYQEVKLQWPLEYLLIGHLRETAMHHFPENLFYLVGSKMSWALSSSDAPLPDTAPKLDTATITIADLVCDSGTPYLHTQWPSGRAIRKWAGQAGLDPSCLGDLKRSCRIAKESKKAKR